MWLLGLTLALAGAVICLVSYWVFFSGHWGAAFGLTGFAGLLLIFARRIDRRS